MEFTQLKIDGAWLIGPERHKDERGWFARVYCEDLFAARGLVTRYPQQSLSFSREKATLRGLHYQASPHTETKIVSCLQGCVWDVLVDLRPDSPTYLEWEAWELSSENGYQLYIPAGCAHGFLTRSGDALMRYLISEPYVPDSARGVRFDDPALGIPWPEQPRVMSDKDRSWTWLTTEP